jgi:hypothetical protein
VSLTKRTKIALDETRSLMLGAQILFGFQAQVVFQTTFSSLSPLEKTFNTMALGLMTLAVGLLIAPSAWHRIVFDGEAAAGFNRFVSGVAAAALLPFALSLALDLFIAGNQIAGPHAGFAAAVAAAVLSISFWYGPLLHGRGKRRAMIDQPEKTPLEKKIDYVLTEARVILPGVQALLGFQLVIIFTGAFTELSASARLAHGAALALTTIAGILLMAPAAYHRIVYDGEEAPDVHRTGSNLLLVATVFLAFGLGTEIYVVVLRIHRVEALALTLAAATVLVLLGLWHVWPWWRSRRGMVS